MKRTRGLLALVALVASLVALPLAGVAGAASTLTLQVGGATADGSVDGQSFYPGVATVHAGDTVVWKFRAAHTVNFYTPPGDPEALGVGNGTFDGVNDPESSGIKFPAPGGDTYQLTFPNAGNFSYFCALHPGMQGLLQVVAVDSPVPATTQAQADQLGATQLAADLAAGSAAIAAFTPGSATSGTKTTYTVANGIGDPQTAPATLTPATAGGPAGSATLSISGTTLRVDLSMTGLTPGAHPAHVHNGQCGISSPPKGAANDIIFPLPDLVADSTGAGRSSADFPLTGPPVIPSNSWYVNVHTSPSDLTSVSCGNVVSHPTSSLRFHPANLTIKTGDTVTWQMMDAREVHPLYVGPEAAAPSNPFAPPSGGNTVASPTRSVLSGPQFPGQSFSLTFTGPGTYTYMCTLHGAIGMKGTVVVQGAAITNAPVPGTLARTGSSTRGPVTLAVVLLVAGALALATERRWRRA